MSTNKKRDKKENPWPSDSKTSEYNRRYCAKNPWAKHVTSTLSTAKARGYSHNLKVSELRYLWERDKGYLMNRPSVDRIDNDLGYFLQNCRFMELSENISRALIGNKYGAKISEEDIHSAVVRVRNGETQTKIARELGVHQTTIHYLIKRQHETR